MNPLAFSPDERLLYVVECKPQRLIPRIYALYVNAQGVPYF